MSDSWKGSSANSRLTKSVLGEMIREARLKKNMSQRELADLLEYEHAQFISLVERGLSKVPYETLGRLIIFLELSEADIMNILKRNFEDMLTAEIESGKATALKSRSR